MDKNEIKKLVVEKLKECFDPEIPIDLWNLGLIYEIKINDKEIEILMTLTTPGCGMANHIADDLKNKILKLKQVSNVNINITFDPIWSPEMMTDEGRVKLGFDKKKPKGNNWE